jgi:hypothetical protein
MQARSASEGIRIAGQKAAGILRSTHNNRNCRGEFPDALNDKNHGGAQVDDPAPRKVLPLALSGPLPFRLRRHGGLFDVIEGNRVEFGSRQPSPAGTPDCGHFPRVGTLRCRWIPPKHLLHRPSERFRQRPLPLLCECLHPTREVVRKLDLRLDHDGDFTSPPFFRQRNAWPARQLTASAASRTCSAQDGRSPARIQAACRPACR